MIEKEIKHIHFIGICGVAMSALAIAFYKKGYKVTGSDKGFYPPVSTHLTNAQIQYYPGWHPEKMGTPDLVIVGNVAGSTNPEWMKIQKEHIPYMSYPEAIAKFLLKKHSIVCAGTYGKTTNTTLLTWILKQTDYNPSYMFGGLSLNNIDAAKITDGKYSILEGDEYKTSRWDNRPKFAHYAPTHLLLTAVEWDHADIYPTEEQYINTFKTLVNNRTNNNIIVASKDGENVEKVLKNLQAPIIWYGAKDADYTYNNIKQTKTGLEFDITHNEHIWHISTQILGEYNAQNICGSFAMAHTLGINPKQIITALKSYKGLKRRLEKRSIGDIDIIDDIAHSTAKVQSLLKNIKKIYNKKIIIVFEPNTGNRQPDSAIAYDDAFANADEVLIPRLTNIKQAKNKPKAFDSQTLAGIISKTHKNVLEITADEALIQHIKKTTSKGDVVIFAGSHGFRGMIETLVTTLQ
jgi:UDP-N-acetylmuramate: L-alanyl-gamma-D-glutamyl-meso-diaminopimelate ligase